MRLDRALIITFLFFGSSTSGVRACEQYKPVTAETRILMETLENERAKPTQRLFALVELSCLSDQTLRRAALETALKSSDRSLRSKALSELLMQREGVRAKLEPIKWAHGYAHAHVEREGWLIDFRFHQRSRERNCINLIHARETCFDRAVLIIDGTQIRINDSGRSMSGEFTLDPNNVLTGFITLRGNSPARATISLL